MSALPTRRDEAWRYSDLAAAASVWPVPAAETVTVAAGESLARTLILDAPDDAIVIHDYAITVAAGASLDFRILNAGGRYGRVALDVTLHAGARFDLGGVIIGRGATNREIVTTVRHAGPGAVSRQVVRCVAGDTATTTYLGKVAVAREGQQTDAAQSFKALLLDRGATANAKPELEIFADDVKCAHGATVGELDANALFYLESRGVPPAAARALLTRAFLSDAFEGLADDARDALEARLEALL
ncbi:Fe-S cluster assembly protein SufD [alpha proteobacterium AAP81b]|nr:Fe-S cluster assembly protein SufD [alpha proteobacterium AAP81b]